jgi:hypothetical protein
MGKNYHTVNSTMSNFQPNGIWIVLWGLGIDWCGILQGRLLMNIERLQTLFKRLAAAQDRGDQVAASQIKAQIEHGRRDLPTRTSTGKLGHQK